MSSSDPPAEPPAKLPEDPPAEPGKKGFNKLFLIIPVVVVSMIVLFMAISINTDIAEHKAFESVEFDVCDYYSKGFDLRLIVCIYNPNSINAKLDRIDLYVYAGNNNVAEITLPYNITIPKNSAREIDADITLKTTGTIGTVFDVVLDKDISIKVVGTAYYDSPFGTFKTPFTKDIDLLGQQPANEETDNQ